MSKRMVPISGQTNANVLNNTPNTSTSSVTRSAGSATTNGSSNIVGGMNVVGKDPWQYAIHRAVKSVVSIHFSNITPFDTERTYVSEATGFVVDAERGIIMTNRHVVGPGPFRGYAVFDNHEECVVYALYRDPVHDFGFLRFNPQDIKHMQVAALDLHPENAKVGCEIRVIGNDAGEKLSILAGVISRVDRNTPDYGEMGYNDFNTEYIQAAASASGGSSGSPVVDINGNVVALQAGGSSVASTDFFLPLFRGKRALQCLQQSQPVTRGTIQVKWLLKPFDECTRLGLTPEVEMKARQQHPNSIGLLVASTTLPEGPADGKVEEGDCLLAVNDTPVAQFSILDDILDSNVGNEITLTLMRGSEQIKNTLRVQNLFDITPDRFVRVSGAVFQNLSYQIASYYAHAVKGVYIAFTGFYLNPTHGEEYTGWVMEELDGHPTPNLDAFIEVVRNTPDKPVAAKFWHVADPHTKVTSVVDLNRHWAGPQDFEMAIKNDETGLWEFKELGPCAKAEPRQRQHANIPPIAHADANPAVSKLNNSIVRVRMLRPGMIDGFTPPEMHAYGFVVDAEKGLVLVSRLCAPHFLVDLTVTVADSVMLPAKVRFLHPQQGYAIIQYDADLIDADLKSIVTEQTLRVDNGGSSEEPASKKQKLDTSAFGESGSFDVSQLPRTRLSPGDPLTCIGYDAKGSAYILPTRVADIAPSSIPLGFGIAPRFRATNIDCVGVDSSIIPDLDAALLADDQGVVKALWLNFLADVNQVTHRDKMLRFALDMADIAPTVAALCASLPARPSLPADNTVDLRFVDIEMRNLTLAQARIHRVPEKWIKQFETAERSRRPELLSVARVACSVSEYLQEGDIIVAVNHKLAIHVSQLLDLPENMEHISLTIIRRGEEVELSVPTLRSSSTVTTELISWCGMSVHKPHHAVLQQVKRPPSQVYVVGAHSGSPATMYDIYATSFVTHVNGTPTPDLDTFYKIAKSIPDDTYVKIRTVNFEGMPAALSMRTNYHYFPTWRIDLDIRTSEWHQT